MLDLLFFSVEKYSLDFYKRMVAFVMAYSFTENQDSPAMVPMADILNHHSHNNAHLVFETDSLKMISLKKIEKVTLDVFSFLHCFVCFSFFSYCN